MSIGLTTDGIGSSADYSIGDLLLSSLQGDALQGPIDASTFPTVANDLIDGDGLDGMRNSGGAERLAQLAATPQPEAEDSSAIQSFWADHLASSVKTLDAGATDDRMDTSQAARNVLGTIASGNGGPSSSDFSKLLAQQKLTGGGFERLLRNADARTLSQANEALAKANRDGTLPKDFIDQYVSALASDPQTQGGHAQSVLSSQYAARSANGRLTDASNSLSAAYAGAALHRADSLPSSVASDVAGTLSDMNGATATKLLGDSPKSAALVRNALEAQSNDASQNGGSRLVRSAAAGFNDGVHSRSASEAVWRGASDALSDEGVSKRLCAADPSGATRSSLLGVYRDVRPQILNDLASHDPKDSYRYQAFLRYGSNYPTVENVAKQYDAQMKSDLARLGSSATYPPMTAADALGNVRGGQDMQYDGNAQFVIKPDADAMRTSPEFGKNTAVIFINGINTDMKRSIVGAQRFADETGNTVQIIHNGTVGAVGDLENVAPQKFGDKTLSPGDQAVRDAILQRVRPDASGKPTMTSGIHFMAHSKGALTLQRGVDAANAQLEREGYTKADIEAMEAKNISIETFGGAANGMPAGVKTVAYYDPHDQVSGLFGAGPATGNSFANDAALAPGFGPYVKAGQVAADGLRGHANRGTLVQVPVNYIDYPGDMRNDLFALNHDLPHYAAYREPFESAFAQGNHFSSVDEAPQQPVIIAKGDEYPTLQRVQDRIDALADNGSMWLPPARSITNGGELIARGKSVTGGGVLLDSGHVAIDSGQGNYVIYQITPTELQDLGDTLKRGAIVHANAGGVVQDAKLFDDFFMNGVRH